MTRLFPHAQVPGHFLFSLLKKYLHVTALAKNDSTSSHTQYPSGTTDQLEEKFKLFSATNQMINELLSVFGWWPGLERDDTDTSSSFLLHGLSIFTGTLPEHLMSSLKKKRRNPYKTREDFSSDRWVDKTM